MKIPGKEEKRKGKIQLINVTSEKFYFKMRKPLGKKRVEFAAEHVNEITRIFLDFKENEYSQIFNNTEFGYSHIIVHRPAKDEQGNIITDKKGNPKSDPSLKDIENIPLRDNIQEFFEKEVLPFADDLPAPRPLPCQFCIYVLKCSDDSFYIGQTEDFSKRMKQHENQEVSWTSPRLPIEPIHWEIFNSREEAVKREQDLKTGFGRKWLKREFEKGTLAAASRQAGAWYEEKETKIGYEINFAKYFYKHVPPRALSEIAKDIFAIEQETEGLLKEIIE